MALQIRRGSEAQRQALSGADTPLEGEPLYVTTTKKLYIGDGVTAGGTSLGYYSSVAVAGQSTLSATNNTETLTLIAGNNVVLATDGPNDSVTISVATTLNELNNGNIRIINNNINGIVGNENINIDPSGTGKVVVNSAINTLGVESNSLQIGTFDTSPTNFYFEIEGPGVPRLFRTGGPGGVVTADFAAYYSTPANGQKGVELLFRQSTLNSVNDVAGNIRPVITDITAGAVDSKFEFTVRSNDAYVVGGSIDGSGFVGNLTGNVTGNLLGDVTGNVTGNLIGDIKGSVFADDSSVLVDSVSGVLRGTHIGNVIGNVTGNISNLNIETFENRIRTVNSNQSIFLDPNGTGVVNVSSNLITSGIQIFGPSTDGGSGDGNILVISQNPATTVFSVLEIHNTSNFNGAINFGRSRGVLGSSTAVQTSDTINQLLFSGHDGSTFRASTSITGVVDGAVSSNIVPGRLEFAATDSLGSHTSRFTISSTSISASVPFRLPVVADDVERTSLVPSPEKGMLIFMEFGTTPAATDQAQVYDGTKWVNL